MKCTHDILEERRIIEQSGLFDMIYYGDTYWTYVKDEPDYIMHYIKCGAQLGLNPSPLFDTRYYLESVDGLQENGMNPLCHYILFGKQEGRVPIDFDIEREYSQEDSYFEWSKDGQNKKHSKGFDIICVQSLLKCGEFDSSYYEQISNIPKANKREQVYHYLKIGMYNGLNPNDMFDIRYYVNHYYPQNTMVVPFLHYIKKGRKKGFKCLNLKHASGASELRVAYAKLKKNRTDSDALFQNAASIRGVLLGQMITNVMKQFVVHLDITINLKIDWTNTKQIKDLIQALNKEQYPFSTCIILNSSITDPESLAQNANESISLVVDKDICNSNKQYLWNVKDMGVEQVIKVLSYFIYCADESVMGILMGHGEVPYVEVIAGADYKISQVDEKIININQCIMRTTAFNTLKREYISLGEFNDYADGGKFLLIQEPSFDNWEETGEKISTKNPSQHIMISIYAMSYGGGEIMPIRLANQLKKMGYPVLVHVFNQKNGENKVRNMLLPNIPVVYVEEVNEMAVILKDYHIKVVNSHHQAIQTFFSNIFRKFPEIREQVRHVATSHGMYDAMTEDELTSIFNDLTDSVDCWTYVADKNLEPFKKKGIYDAEKFIKIPNGIEKPSICPIVREHLGIKEDAFVLCVVSRAIAEKGWLEAVEAVSLARNKVEKDIEIILIGDGPVYAMMVESNKENFVHLLGYKDNPCDYLAIADAMILPSFYKSESAPLSIIEALQCGIPVIASDVGDIRQMLTYQGEMAGCVFVLDKWRIPIDIVVENIVKLVIDESFYEKCRKTAVNKAKDFDIETIVKKYLYVFE